MPPRRKKPIVKGLDRHGRKWRWRRMVDGRPVTVTFKAPTRQDAIAKVLELEKMPEILEAGAWEIEIAAYIADSRAREVLSVRYAGARETALKAAGREMDIDTPAQLTAPRVKDWVDAVRKRTTDGTAGHYLDHLRAFTRWLVEHRRLYLDPCAGVTGPPTESTPREIFLEAGQVRKLLDAARAAADPEIALILLLACECGMRRGEICAARAAWVDIKRGVITIPAAEADGSWKRKGRAGKRKPVSIEIVSELRDWFEAHGVPEPFLVRPEKPWGKNYYRVDFRKRLMSFLSDQGVEGVTIHDLRRSFGSNRVSAGASIERVASWMGIHPRTAWKHYARFVPVTGEIEKGSARSVIEQEEELEPPAGTVRERLLELQGLADEGLITKREAGKRRREILGEV